MAHPNAPYIAISESVTKPIMQSSLTISLKMIRAATAGLQRVKHDKQPLLGSAQDIDGFWIDPMLLAFSMELALKAWWVLDHDNLQPPRTHDLSKLFSSLSEESREVLEQEFKRSVAPQHTDFFGASYSLRDIIEQNSNAFNEWRYLYEQENARFSTSTFSAILEMMVHQYHRRLTVKTPLQL